MTRDENNMTVQYETVYEDREVVKEVEKKVVIDNTVPFITEDVFFDFMMKFDPEDKDQKEELFKLKLKVYEQESGKN